jgi:hypothetical protein
MRSALAKTTLAVATAQCPPHLSSVFTKRKRRIDWMPSRLSAVVVSGALLVAAPSFAAVNSPTGGGTGGSSFSILCQTGQVLVGVKGKTGTFVNQVRGICAELNEIIMPRTIVDSAHTGKTDGADFEQRCPSGWAVRGLRVRRGTLGFTNLRYVNAIKIKCGRLGRDGQVSGTRTHLFWAGGGGGQSTDLLCPNELPGIGIRGRSGDWIDQIGLRCDVATVPAITPAAGSSPDLRVAIRDYGPFVTSNARITWRVELWNVGGTPAQGATVNIVVPAGTDPAFARNTAFPIGGDCNSTAGSGRRCTAAAPIPTGGRLVINVTGKPTGPEGIADVSAIADEPAQIAEINETNNSASETLTIMLPP